MFQTPRRSLQVVSDTFQGNTDTRAVSRLYDARSHPDHLCGMKSRSQIAREFVDAVAAGGCDEVLWPRFAAYHRSVAACTTESQFHASVRTHALRRLLLTCIVLGIGTVCSSLYHRRVCAWGSVMVLQAQGQRSVTAHPALLCRFAPSGTSRTRQNSACTT
jgi:hypothetical protein